MTRRKVLHLAMELTGNEQVATLSPRKIERSAEAFQVVNI